MNFGGAPVQYVEKVTMRGGPNKGQEVVPKDWGTKDAQEARDAIREAGGIPMLPHDRFDIEGITLHNLDLIAPWVVAELFLISDQHSDSVVVAQQLSDKSTTDVAGGSGHQDLGRLPLAIQQSR